MVTPMTGSVKRSSYESPLRAAQAQATRRAIVDAAARLFVENGYGATTVDAIAEAAGVSRKTVFTSVGGKSETLKLAIDWAIVGDDAPVPMMDRPQVKQTEQEPDARRILAMFASNVRGVGERVSRLHAVLESAAGTDEELHVLAEQLKAQRLIGMRGLAAVIGARQALRPGMTVEDAAHVLWLLNDPHQFHALVVGRGWSAAKYEKWLADALVSLLIAPGYRARVRG